MKWTSTATRHLPVTVSPGTVIITHVETPRALRGRGIGARMVDGALRTIRADGLKVVAGCSFARAYLAEHPEHHDLIA